MRRDLYIDGQRRPREPENPLDILDGVGLDRRMNPLPLVFEDSNFDDFIAAGGFPKTVPMPLEGDE